MTAPLIHVDGALTICARAHSLNTARPTLAGSSPLTTAIIPMKCSFGCRVAALVAQRRPHRSEHAVE